MFVVVRIKEIFELWFEDQIYFLGDIWQSLELFKRIWCGINIRGERLYLVIKEVDLVYLLFWVCVFNS